MIVGLLLLILVSLYVFVLSRYRRAGPNEALVIYGTGRIRVITSGGAVVWPLINDWATLSLEPFGLDWNPVTGKTADGAIVTLDGVSQLKIDSQPDALRIAAEVLLHKTSEEMAAVARGAVTDGILQLINERTAEELRALEGKLEMNLRAAEAVDQHLRTVGLRVVSINVEEVKFAAPPN
jgi:flotillin